MIQTIFFASSASVSDFLSQLVNQDFYLSIMDFIFLVEDFSTLGTRIEPGERRNEKRPLLRRASGRFYKCSWSE